MVKPRQGAQDDNQGSGGITGNLTMAGVVTPPRLPVFRAWSVMRVEYRTR